MRLYPMVVAASLVACGGAEQPSSLSAKPSAAALSEKRPPANPNPALYEKTDRPFGREIEHWSEQLWAYIYAQPLDHNPFLDTTGADCAIGQEGPVWYLPSVPGSSLGNEVTRSCTIPRHRAIILQLASAMNDFPCPDPTFKPAPGQSLFRFLLDAITPKIDQVSGFTATLDGVEIQGVLGYRFTSDDLFYFKGNLGLQQDFDTCITGKWQPAVSDGLYLMFKPLPPGPHQIVVHGQDMEGNKITLTENLTID